MKYVLLLYNSKEVDVDCFSLSNRQTNEVNELNTRVLSLLLYKLLTEWLSEAHTKCWVCLQ